ncbi:MAG: hypothetical protein MUO31_15205 [Thermodesulfovibrionales bacterium]|jgi:uncharacterized protein YqeY|nr:hypothetical protein [Thermodesulfovibrionales bacterium]
MTLLQKFNDDLETALKASVSLEVSVLWNAEAALKNKHIDLRRKDLLENA